MKKQINGKKYRLLLCILCLFLFFILMFFNGGILAYFSDITGNSISMNTNRVEPVLTNQNKPTNYFITQTSGINLADYATAHFGITDDI